MHDASERLIARRAPGPTARRTAQLDGGDGPRDRDGAPLCLLSVHAHPDDEASKGAATTARYSDEGVRTVLVCCTGGEAGDVLNPAVDTPEVRGDLAAVRRRELEASAAAIGYHVVHHLGYHDSGMPDTEANHRPDNFANAPLDEAVGRLVAIIRAERPQVLIGYQEDRDLYPHPDHLRVHEITVAAFAAAGNPALHPDGGEPWQPSKLYFTGFSRKRVEALHEASLRHGIESQWQRWFERGFPERVERLTTMIDVGPWLHRRRAALLAHRTQVDPEGFWMRLSDEVVREVFPWEEYELAESLVDAGVHDGEPETDLFAGVRAGARADA